MQNISVGVPTTMCLCISGSIYVQDTVREVKGLSFMHSAFGFRDPCR
jgi:hypothetical protein